MCSYKPSCGPFGPTSVPVGQGTQLPSMYDFFTNGVQTIPEFWKNLLNFIGSLAFVAILIAILG
jgi:hypothetical protein